jgi:tetratricopeptide (TPR) repeat protein
MKSGPFLKLLFGLALLARLAINSPSMRWPLVIFGVAVTGMFLLGLRRKIPDEPPQPEITNTGRVVLVIVICAIPFVYIVPFLFSGGDKLGRRCSAPEEPGSIAACQEILWTRKLDLPDTSRIYHNIGAAQLRAGQYDLAIASYGNALTANSRNAKAHLGRCGAYYAKRDFPAAVKDCEEAIRIAPYGGAQGYLLRGIAYHESNRYKEALQDFSHVLSLEPKNALALAARCDTQNILGETAPALEDCNRALAISPNDAFALGVRGLVHLKAGNYAAALSDYDAALKLDARQAPALYGRGLIKRRKGDMAGADADIAEAVRIAPDVASDMADYHLSE